MVIELDVIVLQILLDTSQQIMKLWVIYQFCVNAFEQGIVVFAKRSQRYLNRARNLKVADITIQAFKWFLTLRVRATSS
jgi:hypothetical protein